MRKTLFFLLIGTFIAYQVNAQISFGGSPISLNNKNLPTDIPIFEIPTVYTQTLFEEDINDIKAGSIPFRFGIDIPVSLTLNNTGDWFELPKGDRIWRLRIKSTGAHSLNLIMKNFYLPQGARLFLLNEAGQYLGSFTDKNNTEEKEFATSPLSGETITLELFEPYYAKGQSSFEITYVIHAYRNVFEIAKDYGQSGPCNINVNCPQGAPWQNQKRSVAMILTSNNTRICSGALVNNVREDGTPYFLTANHCLSGSTSNTWIFMFNYESPGCTNVDGPTNQSVQGSIIRAKDSPSDFALLELTTPPPTTYNVYYSGWNAEDVASDSCVGIHHPSGDIKKITFDYDTVVSSGYSGAGNDHWRILSWNAGTTEGGSSGSPLFDKEKRIIGQLHGGSASCSNLTGYDVYGKFAYSWNTGATPDKRLKDWLDPDNTGQLILDGADFNSPQFNLDAALSQINTPTTNNLCNIEVTPQITIRNNGANELTSLTINFSINGSSFQNTAWTGSLNYLDFTRVDLPLIQLIEGQNNLLIFVSNPNNSSDQNNSNDTLQITFNAFIGNDVIMGLRTDNYPEENSWKLIDSSNNIIYSSQALSAQTLYNEVFCLANGCYKFIISDTYGDGLAGGGWWNPSPPGIYYIVFMGDTLGSGSGNFGFSDTINFCVNSANINNIKPFEGINIFPNPAHNTINIVLENAAESYILEIFTVNGQCIAKHELRNIQNTVNTSTFKRGMYYFRISDSQKTRYFKVVLSDN